MKHLLIATVAVFVTGFVFAFLVHGVLLADDYKAVSHLFRPDNEIKMGVMAFGFLVWAFGVAWLYSKGVEPKPWLQQGFRFGLALACVWLVPTYLGNYATQPFPGMLIAKGLIGDTVNAIACGLVVAGIYKGAAVRSQGAGA